MKNNLSNLETHLAAAIEIGDLAAREAYLRHACEGDSQQLEELQGMVQDYFAAGSLFDRPAVLAPTLDVGGQPEVGAWIGPYKLRELLGEGGMGSVYVAEQEKPVRRKVALKVIKLGMDSRQVIARFEAERQALALMEHINIARVLDAGKTQGGRPYFVMELVRGQPITEHCDIAELDTRQRLELFLQVCRAVQHAHQKGVIHRDLKPSNVLVAMNDAEPVVKVIDFGIAKAIGQQLTDNTLYTAFSQMVGTPLYMSPEQAGHSNLDIDTRSDIYSLGVLLYELLTGDTPFDRETLKQAGFDEIRRIIREIEPPKPSARFSTLKAANQSTIAHQHRVEPGKFSQLLRGELDWIVMKAMEKDRNRRYESANGLARDVERYLNDEPVEACPPSATYRLKKLFRRHQSKVIAATMLLTALMIAVATSVTLAVRERQAAQRRLLVQRGINDALTDVAHLRGLASTNSLGKQETLTRAREQILRAKALADTGDAEADVISRVQQLAAELELEQRDSQLLAALDEAWLTEPNLDWDRRYANDKSLPLLRKALSDYGLRVDQDDPQFVASQIKNKSELVHSAIVAALYEWYSLLAPPIGVAFKYNKDFGMVTYVSPESPAGRDGRLKAGVRIVGIGEGADASFTSTSGMTVSQIFEHLRGEPGTPVRLEVLPNAVKQPQIIELQRDPTADWLWAVIQAADPDPWRQNVRNACELQDVPLRRAELEELVDAADFSNQPVRFLNQVGAELLRVSAIDRATEFLKRLWQEYPDDLSTNISLAISLRRSKPAQIEQGLQYYTTAIALRPESALLRNMRGIVFDELGKTEEAIADFREAIRQEPDYATPHSNLGVVLAGKGKLEEAIDEYRQAIRLKPDVPDAYNNLGNALIDQGKLDEGIAEYREAIRLKPDLFESHANLANVLSSQGRFREAVSEYREAIRLKPTVPNVHASFGDCLFKMEDLETAVSEYREEIRLFPNEPHAFNGLAWLFATSSNPKWRQPAQALELAMKTFQLVPKNDKNFQTCLNTLGIAQYRNGDWKKTLEVLEEAVELSTHDLSFSGFFLAMAHWQLGEKVTARTWYDKSVAWMDQNKPKDEELLRFRAEAAELLGIQAELSSAKKSPPTPTAN